MSIDPWTQLVQERAQAGGLRTLRPVEALDGRVIRIAGQQRVNFSSNNYLALADHPSVTAAVREALDRWGWGAGASRLVGGHTTVHADLERKLAALKNTEAALVCSTGYQANLAAIRALAGDGDVIFLDKLNHHSIIDAAKGSGALVRVFPHRHYDKLERLLQRHSDARRRVIVTDTLFSMDGDFADLPRLVELKQRYDALLCVDEAHATGVWGQRGAGVAELQGVEHGIDVTVGTLSKALGGLGGFVAGSRAFIDWVINSAGAFIYTTALPPAGCAAAIAALEVIRQEPQRRERLIALSQDLRQRLQEADWNTADSNSQIVPVMLGTSEAAVGFSRALEDAGFLVPAIRPPTVPRGQARLRISLCCQHQPGELEALVVAMNRCRHHHLPG